MGGKTIIGLLLFNLHWLKDISFDCRSYLLLLKVSGGKLRINCLRGVVVFFKPIPFCPFWLGIGFFVPFQLHFDMTCCNQTMKPNKVKTICLMNCAAPHFIGFATLSQPSGIAKHLLSWRAHPHIPAMTPTEYWYIVTCSRKWELISFFFPVSPWSQVIEQHNYDSLIPAREISSQ